MRGEPQDLPGADAVITWFGKWPSFHDAEVLSVHIDREHNMSSLRIQTWNLSDATDESGHFIREQVATVVFEFSGIRWIRLEGEDADRQNVIAGLRLDTTADGYRLELAPCYGLAGEVVALQLKVGLE
jgi:hypothetical protein